MSARFVVVGLVLATTAVLTVGCGTTVRSPAGQVTASATADPFQVKLGDCTGDLGTGSVNTITFVPCNQEHYWEAYASVEMTEPTYPGDSVAGEEADQLCGDRFIDWVGKSKDDSQYDYTYLYPTQDTWTQAHDREIVCLAGSEEGGVIGSLKGVKR